MSRMIAAALMSACFAGFPALVSAAAPIAATEGEASGTRIEVQDLKRQSGGTLMLRFTAINDSDQPVDTYPLFEAQEGGTVDGVYLVDLAGKKKYEVVRDAEKHCLCSRRIAKLEPNSRLNLWANFPAPPEGVDKIGVVVPHFIPMDDVPIGK